MTPDIGQRIDAVLQALGDIVMPAMDPTQKAAQEQLGYVMAILKMIANQHDKAYSLAIMEVRLFARLLLKLEAATGDALPPDLQQRLRAAGAADWADWQAPAQSHLEALQREFREIADEVVGALPSVPAADVRQRVSQIVVEHSGHEAQLRRGWMAMQGVEVDVSAFPTLDELVAPAVDRSRTPT
ncbi:MAG TPA: hypothetical protein VFY31_03840 [Macromonas sp.]|nr:hypothetical protein [Macromonas sp.]